MGCSLCQRYQIARNPAPFRSGRISILPPSEKALCEAREFPGLYGKVVDIYHLEKGEKIVRQMISNNPPILFYEGEL